MHVNNFPKGETVMNKEINGYRLTAVPEMARRRRSRGRDGRCGCSEDTFMIYVE